MSHRTLLCAAAAVTAIWLLAACADLESGAEPEQTDTPAVLATDSPSPDETEKADEDGEDEPADDENDSTEERPAASGDCAAYADSDDWCENGIGDYDCDGGPGNGPNYAPRNVEVIEPGEDPFGLDGNNDGQGCEGSAPADDPPPPAEEPGTDPRFDTCADAIDNGYGPYYEGSDPEYDWYRDADSDGIVCER